jgi:hypothetical protein
MSAAELSGTGADSHDALMRKWGYKRPGELHLRGSEREVKWFDVAFADAKTHTVPREFMTQLVADMKQRGCKWEWWRPAKEVVVDLPGMAFTNEPWWETSLAHMMFRFPVTGVSAFASEVATLKVRRFANRKLYYKLHAFHWCVVLSPTVKVALQKALRAGATECEPQAKEFLDKMRTLQDDMAAKGKLVIHPRGRN